MIFEQHPTLQLLTVPLPGAWRALGPSNLPTSFQHIMDDVERVVRNPSVPEVAAYAFGVGGSNLTRHMPDRPWIPVLAKQFLIKNRPNPGILSWRAKKQNHGH